MGNDFAMVADEIREIKAAIGDKQLKVIVESGLLGDYDHIFRASMIAMDAGADFIKTSTGKTPVSATPEAAFVMCHAISDFYSETGIRVGFKAAGGIVTPLMQFSIIRLYPVVLEKSGLTIHFSNWCKQTGKQYFI